MCIGCELKNGDRVKVLEPSTMDCKVYLENVAGTFRLHITNERHHNTRVIYYCPFCGRKLKEMKGDSENE